jgi:hypothetical protein
VKRYVRWITLGGLVASLCVSVLPGGRLGTISKVHAQEQEREKDKENGSCSVATLNGAYGFFRTGTVPGGPLAGVGIITFDGTGAVATARQTTRRNGVTTADLFASPPLVGPYEVDPDCAARFFLPDGSVFVHAVVVDEGNELFIVSLSDANTVYGVMKKINKHKGNSSCSVATLNGTYGFFRTGIVPAGPVVGVGISTRDGNGHATARLTIRRNGVTTSDLFTTPATQGTYEVDPDCTGRELNPDGSVFIHFVVVNGGSEFFILSLTDANTVYGVMKKIDKD